MTDAVPTGSGNAGATVPVTMVITSCKRHDLLERTLRSFLRHNDYPLHRIFIIEDSDQAGVADMKQLFPNAPIETIVNGTRIGQLPSIDKVYALVATEYVFHCEDDWEFGRPGILSESVAILDSHPEILMVLARDEADMPGYLRSFRERRLRTGAGHPARFRSIPHDAHHIWHTFTFNPGLRRLSDYKALAGGYAAIGAEAAISVHYKRTRRPMAWLSDGAVRHIGDDRSVGNSRGRSGLRGRLATWLQSGRRRILHYGRRIGIGQT